MKIIPESGYYNTNKFARIFLESVQEIIGRNGLRSILNYSNLSNLLEDLPPDNLDKAFDFSHFSTINYALEDIYGLRGGRGLALRIGRTTFDDTLKNYGELAGVGDLAFKIMPMKEKIKFGLNATAKIFSEKSDQISCIAESDDTFSYIVERCPVCWGRQSESQAVCYYRVGLLKEGLNWITGGREFQIEETKCVALGDKYCEFTIQKNPLN